jgi:chromate transporter
VGALFLSFLKLGAVSFGGPAMVAYIRRLAVRQRSWVGEDEFERGVALCQAVPGATAMQRAAWVGLRARGLSGAVAAYVGFGLPAFVLMLALSYAYSRAHDLRIVTSALAGLRALVVALAANACWVFARRSVTGGREGALAVIAAGLFLLGGNPFVIVVAAGLAGALVLRGDDSGRVATAASAIASPRGAFRGPALVIAVAGAVVAAAFALGGRRLGALRSGW